MAPDASGALAARQKVYQLLTAARTGNLKLLKQTAKQLDEGNGIAKTVADVSDGNKRGALHFAAREGKTEICQFLLEDLGLLVDPKDEEGETPLLHAAWNGHIACALYLLQQGADPCTANNMGATALHHSAAVGNVNLVVELLARGVPVDLQSSAGSPLIYASGHGHFDVAKTMLEHNANPNSETEDGATPLVSAVAAGSLPCTELLIQSGADVNFIGGGTTPLLVAAESGNVVILNSLLKAGANVNVMAGGTTALHVAAYNGSLGVVKVLLEAGADPNVVDEDSHKAIQLAGERGHKSVVETLLPLTVKVDSIPEWSINEILKHMQTKTNSAKDAAVADELAQLSIRREVSDEDRTKAADAKSRGDKAFRSNDLELALQAYTQAIDFNDTDAALFSNRSLCWLRLGKAAEALSDAKACRELRPDWPKACYREGAALCQLQRYEDAANSFYEGVKLDPDSKELVSAFREAVELGRKQHGTCQK